MNSQSFIIAKILKVLPLAAKTRVLSICTIKKQKGRR